MIPTRVTRPSCGRCWTGRSPARMLGLAAGAGVAGAGAAGAGVADAGAAGAGVADAGTADAGAMGELRDRFADRLHFGTAGLRGVVAAGPNRMNRAVVRAATAAVAGWLMARAVAGGRGVSEAGGRGVSEAGGRGRPGRAGGRRPGRRGGAGSAGERGGGLRREAPVGGVRRGGGRGPGRGGHRGARAPAALPHSPARVRGPPAGRGCRGDGHREPQPGRRQRVQALPERRRPGHPAHRRRHRAADRRPGAAVAGPGGRVREPADHPPRRRGGASVPGRGGDGRRRGRPPRSGRS